MSKLGDDVDRIIAAHEARKALQKSREMDVRIENERKKEAMTDRFTECIEGVILPAMSDARLRLNKNGYSCTIEAPFEVHTDTQKKRYKTIHFRASTEEGADLSESRTAMLTPTLCVAPMTSGGKFDVRFLKVGSTPEYCEIMLDGMTDEIIAGQLSRFLARVYV